MLEKSDFRREEFGFVNSYQLKYHLHNQEAVWSEARDGTSLSFHVFISEMEITMQKWW